MPSHFGWWQWQRVRPCLCNAAMASMLPAMGTQASRVRMWSSASWLITPSRSRITVVSITTGKLDNSEQKSAAHQPAKPKHAIRSYVLRQGRITKAQRRAVEGDAAGLVFRADAAKGLTEWLTHAQPLWLDIGSGMGDSTVDFATAYPNWHLLAVEVHTPGVGALLGKIRKHGSDQCTYIPRRCGATVWHVAAWFSGTGKHPPP